MPIFFMMPPIQAPVNDIQIKPTVEIRERFERRLNRDFDKTTPTDRSDLLTRIRVGADIQLDENVKANLTYQYAHNLAWTRAKNFSTEDSDLYLANVEFKENDWVITLGRQRLMLGDQRLLGPSDWGNVARSFDGIHVKKGDWRVFGAGIGVASPRPKNARIGGVVFKKNENEVALLYKHDSVAAGKIDIYTLNHIWKQKKDAWDFEFEGALQAGKNLGKDHEAWAIHAGAGYSLNNKTRLFVEVNSASGGDPAGSKSKTFDQLYGTGHNKYGIIDMVGFRNMNEIAFGVDYKPCNTVDTKTAVRIFSLQNAKDAWYGAGGSVNKGSGGIDFHDPTGMSGRDLGHEFDFELWWRYDKRTTLHTGFAVFYPGNFVKNLNSGKTDPQWWLFMMLSWKM